MQIKQEELIQISNHLHSIAKIIDGMINEKPKEEVDLEKVRALLAEKSLNGFTKEIRELIKSFGAEKLSMVDPIKLSELYEKAKEIGNA